MVEIRPQFLEGFWWRAVTQLESGDTAGYRRTCETMLERFGPKGDDPKADLVPMACILAPRAVADLPRVVRLAEKDLSDNVQRANGFTLNVLGAALYRAGRYGEAIERLSGVIGAPVHGGRWKWAARASCSPAIAGYFLAMAHHRLGDADQARTWLNKAVKWTDELLKDSPRLGPGSWIGFYRYGEGDEVHWNYRLELMRFRREAEALLGKPPPATQRTKEGAPEKKQ